MSMSPLRDVFICKEMTMRPPTITLTETRGLEVGRQWQLSDRSTYVLGRAEDCYPRLPDNLLGMDVSRHHCLLRVQWPQVWVRDLGSKNGTYVNGEPVNRSDPTPPPSRSMERTPSDERPVQDGDEITLGINTILRVQFPEPAHGAGSGY
jgi:serine/threonine-protein kinase